MNEKEIWTTRRQGLIGGGLDALMILAALERIEEKLGAIDVRIRSKKRKRPEASDPCSHNEYPRTIGGPRRGPSAL